MSDHGHDHDDEVMSLEDNPIWQQDNVILRSVGMDVGSSGTQVAFSRLHLRRVGERLTSRYVVVKREVLYQSPVVLTPYRDNAIDAEELGGIVDRAYAEAKVEPAGIDTGVVILTGEALRRRNARRITEVLARRGGDLVAASAGHHLEARLAAYGSGAARRSYERGSRILNVDIGGGTVKLAVVDRGAIAATAAVHVGGRLVVVDADGRIVQLEPAAVAHAERVGMDWSLGQVVSPADLARVAEGMAELLVDAVVRRPLPDHVAPFVLTDLIDLVDIDQLQFSGGVAEYVYDRETPDLGDLGPHLGRAVRARVDQLPGDLLPAGECIRATVLGASQFTVQLSGHTSWIVDADRLLPCRDLPVVRPSYTLGGVVASAEVADAIRAQLSGIELEGTLPVALALHFSGEPSYQRLESLARGVVDGLGERAIDGTPLYVALDGDVALTLGRILSEELNIRCPMVVLDGLELWDLDYIDLGRVQQPSSAVPVTIKSLVFDVSAGSTDPNW